MYAFLPVIAGLAASPSPSPPPCISLWTPIVHSQGLAWRYNADNALVVVLVGDTAAWGRGLHVVYNGVDHGISSGPDLGNKMFGPLLAPPPTSGPTLLSTCPLTVRVGGSSENGCDELGYDDALAVVTVASTAMSHQIAIQVEGTVYWALPPSGMISVVETSGPHPAFDASLFAQAWNQYVYSQSDFVTQTGTTLGNLHLDVQTALPWLQLEGHGPGFGFVEVDMDHSCEAQYQPLALPVTVLRMSVQRQGYPVDPSYDEPMDPR